MILWYGLGIELYESYKPMEWISNLVGLTMLGRKTGRLDIIASHPVQYRIFSY